MPLAFKVESDVFPLPARTFISDRIHPTYRRFLAKEMKVARIVFMDTWEEDGKSYLKIVTSPDVSEWMPQRYASYVRYYTDSIEYHDTVEYDPAALQQSPYTFKVAIKPAFTDYVSTSTTLTISEVDKGSCKQMLEGEITCSVVGIGSYVEAYLRDSLVKIYAKFGEVVSKWAQHREALLADPSSFPALLLDREMIDLVAPSITWPEDKVAITIPRTTAKADTEEPPHPLAEDPDALAPQGSVGSASSEPAAAGAAGGASGCDGVGGGGGGGGGGAAPDAAAAEAAGELLVELGLEAGGGGGKVTATC